MSNRAHNMAERGIGKFFLLQLMEALRPSKIVAVGGDAALTLQHLGLQHVKVRHPSYGGQRDFCDGISTAYNLRPESLDKPQQLPF